MDRKIDTIIELLGELFMHNSFWSTLVKIGIVASISLLLYTLSKDFG